MRLYCATSVSPECKTVSKAPWEWRKLTGNDSVQSCTMICLQSVEVKLVRMISCWLVHVAHDIYPLWCHKIVPEWEHANPAKFKVYHAKNKVAYSVTLYILEIHVVHTLYVWSTGVGEATKIFFFKKKKKIKCTCVFFAVSLNTHCLFYF